MTDAPRGQLIDANRQRQIEELAQRKYPIVIKSIPEELGGGWRAELPDLPGCVAQDDSLHGVLMLLEDAKRAWIEAALEEGRTVPEPSAPQWQYSGRVLVRMPRSLHRTLSEMAEQEGTSLNQLIVHLLSRSVGAAEGRRAERRQPSLGSVRNLEGESESLARVLRYVLGGPSEWQYHLHRPFFPKSR